MRKSLLFLFVLCLIALLYPCEELLCWDTAGNRVGYWSETSCDGKDYSGVWTGNVTNDCRFIGTAGWKSLAGTIEPSTKVLTATGTIRKECGPVTMNGGFSSHLISVRGSYKYSKGGGGSFFGEIQP